MKKIISLFMSASLIVTNSVFSAIAANAAEETTTFTAHINVYNEETNEPVPGIEVKFVEYDADLPTKPEPEANVVQVLAEWNTTDINPYEVADVEFVEGHFYAVQIDNIPEGYCYSWEDHVITGIHIYGGGTLSGDVNYNIALQPHDPMPTLEYPIDITRDFSFSVLDMSTNTVVEGLDVELVRMESDPDVINKFNYAGTLAEWNTSEEPEYNITLPLYFESMDSLPYMFGAAIKNMPEGYQYYHNDLYDGYTVFDGYGTGDYRHDLYIGDEVHEAVLYIQPVDYQPTYTTTKPAETTMTTTKPAETTMPTTEPVETTMPTTEPAETTMPTTEPAETTMPTTEPAETTMPTTELAATTTTTNNETGELPQTGYSDIYKVIAGLASIMTVSGTALVVKTRKENE